MSISMRAPLTTIAQKPAQQEQQQPPPSAAYLIASPWRVSYSSLPLWKDKRNVKISHTLIPATTSTSGGASSSPPQTTTTPSQIEPISPETRLDDLVTYQTLKSDRLRTVHGIDRPVPTPAPVATLNLQSATDANNISTPDPVLGWAWKWRGTGLLLIASSAWEILGYGDTPTSCSSSDGEGSGQWAVTYFAQTLFTPAGIDIYTRPHAHLPETLLREVKDSIRELGDEKLSALVDGLFAVAHDDEGSKGGEPKAVGK